MPPSLLAELDAIIGPEATAALVAARRGRRQYVPAKPRPGHALVKIIGLEAARKLAKVHGGVDLAVPLGGHLYRLTREEFALGLLAAGESVQAVAQAVWATERWVYRVKSRAAARAAAGPSPVPATVAPSR